MKKLTKKQIAKHSALVEQRLTEMETLRATFTGKTLPGVLRWFDASSGEGVAEVEGHSIYVHFSAIDGVDKNGYAWPNETDRKRLDNIGFNVPASFKVWVAGDNSLMAESVNLLGKI